MQATFCEIFRDSLWLWLCAVSVDTAMLPRKKLNDIQWTRTFSSTTVSGRCDVDKHKSLYQLFLEIVQLLLLLLTCHVRLLDYIHPHPPCATALLQSYRLSVRLSVCSMSLAHQRHICGYGYQRTLIGNHMLKLEFTGIGRISNDASTRWLHH